ncbi:MAG: DUF1592 domain-containing protein, partial [Verrucomicrobiota bacterium]
SYFPLSAAQIGGKEPTKSTPLGLDKYLATKHPEKLKSNLRTLELDATSENPKNHPNPRDRGTVREGKGAHGYEVVLPHDGRNTRQGTISYLNKEPLAPGHYKVVVYAYAEKSLSKEGVLLEPTGACLLGLDVDQVRVAERTVPISDQPQKFEFDIYSPHLRIVVGAATNVNRADLAGIPSLVLCEVDITGPLNEQWPPKSHRALFGPDGKWTLEETLSNFVTRAFRRPALPEEIAKYKAIADEEIKAGATPEVATKVALQSVLISPNFLFLVEESRPDRNLNDFEFASRLSYFLWSSMPDEELFALATKGKLREPKTLKMQLLRMLRDPKAEALVSTFASQWIGFRRLSEIAPDPTVFPTWDEDLRKAMRQESEELFRYVMHENLPVLNFLDSDFTFLNERLAKHYGIPDVTGGDFRKVALKPEYGRGGLLTQAGVLTLASQPTRSSPVFRGKFVLDKLFNRPPAPPPASPASARWRSARRRHRRSRCCSPARAAPCRWHG